MNLRVVRYFLADNKALLLMHMSMRMYKLPLVGLKRLASTEQRSSSGWANTHLHQVCLRAEIIGIIQLHEFADLACFDWRDYYHKKGIKHNQPRV